MKALLGWQTVEEVFDLCSRGHSVLPPTFQMVYPLMFPTTVQLNVKASPGHVGGAAVNCPTTLPGAKHSHLHMFTENIGVKGLEQCCHTRKVVCDLFSQMQQFFLLDLLQSDFRLMQSA